MCVFIFLFSLSFFSISLSLSSPLSLFFSSGSLSMFMSVSLCSCLSLSFFFMSLSLSLFWVWVCHRCIVGVCVCVCVCVRGTLKTSVCRFIMPPCVDSKRLRVCRQKRPCHMRHERFGGTRRRVESTHGGVLNLHTHTHTNTHTNKTPTTHHTNLIPSLLFALSFSLLIHNSLFLFSGFLFFFNSFLFFTLWQCSLVQSALSLCTQKSDLTFVPRCVRLGPFVDWQIARSV